MFHKKNVTPLPDYTLSVQFYEGVTKMYDLKSCRYSSFLSAIRSSFTM